MKVAFQDDGHAAYATFQANEDPALKLSIYTVAAAPAVVE